jgi:peptidyl-prolyl cis-trans isomerase D
MLDFFRKKSQSTVIQLAILAIILVFIFWGVGGQQGNEVNALATVNGEKLSTLEYQRLYDRKLNQLRDQLGGEIPAGLLEAMDLKKQVVDELIKGSLIRQGAAASGLAVSDVEVRQAIEEMPAFRNNGVFDVKWYKDILASNRMSVTDFENSLRADLLTAKVFGHLARFGGISEAELKERFGFDFREKKFSYVAFGAAEFEKRVLVSDKELADYFATHKDKYLGQPEVDLKYVLFPFDGSAATPVSDEEVAAYYEQHRDEFADNETRRARHILLRVGADAAGAELAGQQARAEALVKEARSGKDFADLARKNSDDKASAVQGGDLGYFGRGQMVKNFEETVFGLAKGGVAMIRTDFGFHVIKLEDVRPGRVKSLAEAKDAVVAAIRKTTAKNLAFKQASDSYEKIILSGSLDKFAAGGGITMKQTGLFNLETPPALLKDEPAFQLAAANLKKGELSSIIDGQSAYAVFFAQEVRAPRTPDLFKVREQVKADFAKERAVELARAGAERFLAALKAGGNMAGEAQKIGMQPQESPYISRAALAGSQLPAGLMDAGLSLTAANPYPKKVEQVDNAFYVLAFAGDKGAPESLLQQRHEELAKRLGDENRARLVVAWESYLHDQAKIEISPAFAKADAPVEKEAPAK